MSQKTASQIRQDFLSFFKDKGHAVVPSAPVVPHGDSTLLFTNAGMNQFKPIFLEEEQGVRQNGKIWLRAVDSQRCIRVSGKHNDLEEVGRDTYHHTFFEMLGNWSFGDYFKKEAVAYAWELLTEKWELEPDRLYATVFEGDKEDGLPADSEAAKYWETETGIASEHILNGSKKDNFWEMGNTGPCGPCSEVHIDLRSSEEREKKPGAELVNKDHPQVMEIWNLVFIQFNRKADGLLKKLPRQHVDTGMGFERMCAVLQGKSSNYDTDLFAPLLKKIGEIAQTRYGKNDEKDIAFQVTADHIRSISFAIADGVSPSNEGRGYVIRRILRRAVRFGWDKLELKKPFLYRLVPVLAKQFEQVFPVLKDQQDFVMNVIEAEEKSFLKTLGEGIELFNEMTGSTKRLSGQNAFKLHDTYGFPIDLTRLMAEEKGINVDMKGFEAAMQKQKERARAAGSFEADKSAGHWQTVNQGESEFVGYDQSSTQTKILAARGGDKPALILEKTPFYAESGGQVADTGIIKNETETLHVFDVQKRNDRWIHYVESLPDDLGGCWEAKIDIKRRKEIMKHHSAVHLVNAALRQVLGDQVKQRGSFVNENYFRFDFSHYEPVTQEQLNKIEKMVNNKIQQNIERGEERNIPIEQAKERGVLMMANTDYGDKVRVISFEPEYSLELCGGTHVA
ncbi:MAG TPA: alanine--tRNA ligase, partial [Balneolaceae bacterium]|nr:alanine--tRNA ligase [Balneolaceae bacterium]